MGEIGLEYIWLDGRGEEVREREYYKFMWRK
jgi:hypothetical protein